MSDTDSAGLELEPIECRIGDVVRCGRSISVESVDPHTLLSAVRGEPDSGAKIAVRCNSPTPVHEFVGYIHPEMSIRTRTALAAAARSRGLETAYDEPLQAVKEELAALSVPPEQDDRKTLREQAADATNETAELRESVAAARGRLVARREAGLDPTPAADALAEAVARLSEVETDAVAATQRLETERATLRERRTMRERRFRLEDRLGNLERAARAALVEQVEPAYLDALSTLPHNSRVENPYDGAPMSQALAVARVADLVAPVVLACEKFLTPDDVAHWLGCPVVRI